MKYLMLFEAFESNALSKMMTFLGNKVDNNSKGRFQDKLKRLIRNFDIPIDKIVDKDVKYLNRNQALKLKNEERSDSGLYCLKFWFSMDEGFLGFTGTGNRTMDFNEYLEGNRRRRRSSEKNEPFSNKELNYIKNDLDIKTGKLTPLKDYEDLRHGQLVVGFFSDNEDDESRIGLSKIWRDGSRIFAIQDVASGGTPDYDVDGESWSDWRSGNQFRYSWSLDTVDSPGNDHHKLHIYTPSDEPLRIEGVKKEEEEEVKVSSPFDFNLPLNSRYELREWGETSYSIDEYTFVEKSDFAIVLMIDDILKSVEKKVSKLRTDREESREGASRLMSDEKIKNTNIERYLLALITKMGIESDVKELKNLQKLVLKSVCDDFAFISIYKVRPGFDGLNSITRDIYNMMKVEDKSDKEYYLKSIINRFKSLNSSSEDYIRSYMQGLKIINDSNIEPIKELFKIIMGIGKKIKDYLLSQNIQTLEDLRMVMAKLKSINILVGDDEFSFNSYTRSILNEFLYDNDVKYYMNDYNERKEPQILEDIKKAKHIERYVDSLLR
jgi:hypothetical protein